MTPLSFADFTTEVLSFYAPPLRAALTHSKMRQVLGLVAALPGVALVSDLTPAAVAAFVRSRSDAGANPNTALGQLAYLRSACQFAVVQGYLEKNPCAARKGWIRKTTPIRRKHHSRTEIAAVLEYLRARSLDWEWGRLHAFAAVLAYAGLRRMEALRLRVIDVDPARGFLFVRPNGRPLKTEGSEAPVPMPAALCAVLATWLPRTQSEWLFPGVRHKGPWVGGAAGWRAGDRLKIAAAEAGVEGLTCSSLRHSLATHYKTSVGLSAEQVKLVLRHTTEATQDHYVHPDLEGLAALVRGFDFAPGPEAAERKARKPRRLPRKRMRRAPGR